MQARIEQIQATFQKHHQAFLTQHPPLSTPPPPAKVLKGKRAAAVAVATT